MRKLAAMTVIVFVLFSGTAFADSNVGGKGRFGLGLAIGDPTGLTAKYMLNRKTGISTTVEWKTSGETEINASFDVLFHTYGVVEIRGAVSPVYVGAGLRLRHQDREGRDDEFAIRVPIGIECLFTKLPVGAFAELVPTLDVKPDTEIGIQLSVGIRYYF